MQLRLRQGLVRARRGVDKALAHPRLAGRQRPHAAKGKKFTGVRESGAPTCGAAYNSATRHGVHTALKTATHLCAASGDGQVMVG